MIGCSWLYFRELVDYHSIVQMFKLVNIGTPINLRNRIEILPDKKISIPPARLRISSKSFRWRTTQVWNDLPDHILLITKLSVFKKTLKKHIIDGRAEIALRRPPDWD